MPINRVLLAHRDPVVQEVATRTLGRIGVALDITDNTADALAHLRRETYNVVALDRDDAVLAAISGNARGPRPVVIVTTDDRANDGLDPTLVSLVVPAPYDAQTLVGVILACVTPEAEPPAESADGPALSAC